MYNVRVEDTSLIFESSYWFNMMLALIVGKSFNCNIFYFEKSITSCHECVVAKSHSKEFENENNRFWFMYWRWEEISKNVLLISFDMIIPIYFKLISCSKWWIRYHKTFVQFKNMKIWISQKYYINAYSIVVILNAD